MSPIRLFLWYWLPATVWLVLVALFSSSALTGSNTLTWLEKLLQILNVRLDGSQLLLAHYLFRKTAHFISYGILSALLFRAFRGTANTQRQWRLRWAFLALIISLIVASSDEFHQLFTPGREGTLRDVVLDTMGAAFAQIIVLLWTSRLRARRD
jgi:VanZ family protein